MEPDEQSIGTKTCPACRGIGYPVNSMAQTQDPACILCEGRGFVVMVRDMSCGRPGFFVKDKIYFCGRDACFSAIKGLQTRREAKKKWTTIERPKAEDINFKPWEIDKDEPDEMYWAMRGRNFMA